MLCFGKNELYCAVQSCVSRVNSSGPSTQPCGDPVLSLTTLEVLFPMKTDYGLSVRKSKIQMQREVFIPCESNFFTSSWGMTVLNAELKSINSILT